MKLQETIRRILREEVKKDLTRVIQTLLDGFVNDHKDILCKVEVKHPNKRKKLPYSDNDYENYRATFYFISDFENQGGWNISHVSRRRYDDLMNTAWDLVNNIIGVPLDMFTREVKSCE
jgi:hypothetical protein